MPNLQEVRFADVDLSDPFFDSLKSDYREFPEWFRRKAEEPAYVHYDDTGRVDGFLYVKLEDGELGDVAPKLPSAHRLKVGTMKISPHGTLLGERFVKKIFDHALKYKVDEIYTTVFPKHEALIKLLGRYGFCEAAKKGGELVLARNMRSEYIDILASYPYIKLGDRNIYLLAIYPKWHTRLFPDSILNTESAEIISDISHTNSIHKVYIAGMQGMERLQSGDILLIYRTADNNENAEFKSVATSICVVEEYRHIRTFVAKNDFLGYCERYSVFDKFELSKFWDEKKYQHIIRFTYNLALTKRVTRKWIADNAHIDRGLRWGFMPLKRVQFLSIIKEGKVDETVIVD
ncbi:hypothetical protein AGMMS50229_02170 [Campylobacterota bacterium]|nr:hypothetical protein AGMMS50229_02170 [Campylobacterota bacterium]